MNVRGRLLAALLALLLWPALATAQTFPKFTGLVVDDAGRLTANQKASLEAKLDAFQQRTHRQLVVATIADLQGYTQEDYGYRLGRSWGVGLRNVDNGVVLFIAPNAPVGQRGARIEVGYRLEPVLTDALASVIVNRDMLPLLKQGDIAGGLNAGADAIIQQLSLPDDQAKARMDGAVREFDRTHARARDGAGGVPLGLIFWGMVAGFVILAHFRRRSGPASGQRYGGGGGGGSNWPIWLWAASEMMGSVRERDRGGGWIDGGDGGGLGGGGSDGSWGGGGFTGGGGGSFGGGGASGSW